MQPFGAAQGARRKLQITGNNQSWEGFMITGGRVMVECLRREAVDFVFGIPGTQNLGALDALREAPDIRFILTRHEQGAAFMAYGFGRATGRPGVVTATEGPGVTNLATPIAAAFKGFVPLISITGNQEETVRDRGANQDIDQSAFLAPITKWVQSVRVPETAQAYMRKAFRIALTEPVGPVHV